MLGMLVMAAEVGAPWQQVDEWVVVVVVVVATPGLGL
jgi:hypothetical protein